MSDRNPKEVKSILVVDDEPDIRMVLDALLTSAGYSVTGASDGVEALDILEKRDFNLIILDLMMPRMSGEEVMEHIKRDERFKRMPVLMLTAKAQDKDINEGYARGANFYMTKPFSNTEIKETVNAILNGKKLAGGE